MEAVDFHPFADLEYNDCLVEMYKGM